jgi:hypothetical protein
MVRATEQHTTSDAHLFCYAQGKVSLFFIDAKNLTFLGVV